MPRNATTRVAEEGPFINGRPALTIREVQRWFKDAAKVTPPAKAVVPIAQGLNQSLLFQWLWSDKPTFKQMRRNSAPRLLGRRIGEALRALQKDLPTLLEGTLKTNPNTKSSALAHTHLLLDLVNQHAPAFEKFAPPPPGRAPKGWHKIARKLGPLIIKALKKSGLKRAGFGQPTSPAVGIIRSALSFLGVETTREAIVDAMRNRKKPGKTIS